MDLDMNELLELERGLGMIELLEVWERLRQLKIQEQEGSNGVDAAEKRKLVNAIMEAALVPKSRFNIDTLLNRPSMLLHEGELAPKGALRL